MRDSTVAESSHYLRKHRQLPLKFSNSNINGWRWSLHLDKKHEQLQPPVETYELADLLLVTSPGLMLAELPIQQTPASLKIQWLCFALQPPHQPVFRASSNCQSTEMRTGMLTGRSKTDLFLLYTEGFIYNSDADYLHNTRHICSRWSL